jgi:hypothetical protein
MTDGLQLCKLGGFIILYQLREAASPVLDGSDKEEVTRRTTFIWNSRNGLVNGIYRDEAKIRSGKGHTISTTFMELISGQLFSASNHNSIVSLCNWKWTFKGFNHGI